MALDNGTQIFNFNQIQARNIDVTEDFSINSVEINDYITSRIGVHNAMTYKGSLSCSGNPNLPSANAGDVYYISSSGRLGGASGFYVETNDIAICKTDSSAEGDYATVGTNWDVVQGNIRMDSVAITGGSITGITDLAVADGGTGVSVSGVNKVFYVDGSRSDTYTADGSMSRPYKTIKACQDAINVITAGLIGSEANYETAKFVIKIAPGKYTDNLAINAASAQAKYIRYDMEGVEISGNIVITQEQLGLTDYYSKVEFVGGYGAFPEKGRCGRITGTITFAKSAYDSLAYDNFFGVEITGAILFGAAPTEGHGTWVLGLQNSYISADSSITTNFAVGDHCVLLVTNGFNKVKCALTGEIDLYDCNNTTFYGALTITPTAECRLKNCHFTSTVSIIASKNLYADLSSMKSLYDRTPTLTGMTVIPLDGVGMQVTPLSAAEINALFTTPKVIVNAITGKTVIVDSIALKMTRTATQFAAGGDLEFRITDASGDKVTADIASGVVTGGAGVVYTSVSGITAALTGVLSAPIVAANATQLFTTGTGTAVVTVLYHIV